MVLHERAKPQTTGSSVKFYQPWILIVYSRIILGMWKVVLLLIFFLLFHLHHFFMPGELSRPKNTHTTDNKFLKCFIFVCDGHHGFISCQDHDKLLTFDRDHFEIFHSPTPPLYVILINVLQKSWLIWVFVHSATAVANTTLHKVSSCQFDKQVILM